MGNGFPDFPVALIVHCDFKPDNVLVGKDGRPRVVDFGLARLGREQILGAEPAPATPSKGWEVARASSSAFTGTPGYMSPEQYDGAQVAVKSDQFSFCAALYEALYHTLPFAAPAPAEYENGVLGPISPPPPGTQVPQEVRRILVRGLASDPAERFPSMRALLDALAVEIGQTAAAAASTRRWIIFSLTLVMLAALTLGQIQAARGRLLRRASLTVSVLLLSVCLSVGYVQRQSLKANLFHFRMWALFLVTFLQVFFERIIGNIHELKFSVMFSLEMVLWAGMTATIAATLIRRLWWLPGVLLLFGVAAVVIEPPPRGFCLLAYPLGILTVLRRRYFR